jgi:hypothetical protein
MKKGFLSWASGAGRGLLAVFCAFLLAPGDPGLYAQAPPPNSAPQEPAPQKIPNDQLDSLVAPIALYPDPLLAQMLAASTYPLEIIQLQQWMMKHKDLKGKALADAVEKEDWDPSVQAMAPLPDALKQLSENIQWTTDLGNAFLAQQSDVMDSVQRMRMKAQGTGALKSSEQQKVETKVVENKTVVVIEPSKPDVVYVPSYDPVVVYGPPVYPYPPIVYPTGAYLATAAVSFGVGMMVGAAMSGGWGWGCGWGGNNTININNSNNFVNNSNRNTNRNTNRNQINGGNRAGGGSGTWQHNPQHRGGAPYGDRATANKFGGTDRGSSAATRQASARQNQSGRQSAAGRDAASNRPQPGGGNRGGADAVGNRSAGGGAGGNRSGGGGADRVGNRSVGSGSGSSRGGGGFGGGSGGYSGSSARSSSAQGRSSMGSRGGGGGSRGGGGRRR